MKKQLTYSQIDVFTKHPYYGNPLAVINDGDQLSDSDMQLIAKWTNLSETTFICSPSNPQADYRLRIFTPRAELPFAGHPTIGSAQVALNNGIVPKNQNCLIQECKQGLVPIYLDQGQISFALPKPKITEIKRELQEKIGKALGVKKASAIIFSEMIDIGAVWCTIFFDSVDTILALEPNDEELIKLLPPNASGVTVFAMQTGDTAVEVRSFAPAQGVHEDPVCGSGNGAVAVLIKKHHLLEKQQYTASQGQKLNRAGKITVNLNHHGEILVGGHAVECISGKIVCPSLNN